MSDERHLAELARVYDRGRLMLGLQHAPLAAVVGFAFFVVGASWAWTLAVTPLLGAALVAAAWVRTSALHGARLGLLGVLAPLVAVSFMSVTDGLVTMQTCMQVCLSVSVAGGLVVGALGGLRASRTHALPYFVGFASTALLAGSGGCMATGVGNALGLAVALVVAAAPAYVIGRMGVARA